MSEGTKIGDLKEDDAFKATDETQSGSTLTATKIGEVSEFEKSLKIEDTEEVAPEPEAKKKEPKKTTGDIDFVEAMEAMEFDYQEGGYH